VAVVYAVLMQFNVVYTLFFATSLVCLLRGAGWWAAHLIGRRRSRRAAAVAGTAEGTAAAEGAVAA
jgi:hypothetical protein